MENELLQLPAVIESIKSRVDGSWSIGLSTQELSEEGGSILLRLNRKLGYFLFKETPMIEADLINVPEITPEFKGDKTPSQRLRARMFVYYKETKGKEEGFNDWYASSLEKIGQSYLDKMEKGEEQG